MHHSKVIQRKEATTWHHILLHRLRLSKRRVRRNNNLGEDLMRATLSGLKVKLCVHNRKGALMRNIQCLVSSEYNLPNKDNIALRNVLVHVSAEEQVATPARLDDLCREESQRSICMSCYGNRER